MSAPARSGWGSEDGLMIHLASEMAVGSQDGAWWILDLDDNQIGPSWPSAAEAMDEIDRSYAQNPRHALDWEGPR